MLGKRILLAGTSGERRRGLLNVSSLDENGGLWIIPCEAIHTFLMKLSIDSVFLDKQLRVRKLKPNLRPFRIAVCLKAYSVLELPCGTIASSGTELGDHLTFTSIGLN